MNAQLLDFDLISVTSEEDLILAIPLSIKSQKPILLEQDGKHYSLSMEVVKEVVQEKLGNSNFKQKIDSVSAILGEYPYGIIFGTILASHESKTFYPLSSTKKEEGVPQCEALLTDVRWKPCNRDQNYVTNLIQELQKSGIEAKDRIWKLIVNDSLTPEELIEKKKICVIEQLTSEELKLLTELE